MTFRITVISGDRPPFDAWVDADPDAPITGVLAAAGGSSESGALIDGRRTTPDATVAQAGLREGSLLTLGAGGPPSPVSEAPDHPWRLSCTAGPLAGMELPLRLGVQNLGRSRTCELAAADEELSRRHAAIEVSADRVRIRDLSSLNGTFVNGVRVSEDWATLDEGAVIGAGSCEFTFTRALSDEAVLSDDGAGGLVLNRTFRIRREPTSPVIDWPSRPTESARRAFPWIVALIPLLGAIVLAAFTRQPTFLLFALLSPLTMWGSQWSDNRSERARASQNAADHDRRVSAARSALDAAIDADRRRWADSFPGPQEILRIVAAPKSRLWERRPDDDDFLCLRVGMGTRRSSVSVRAADADDVPDLTVPNAQISVDLRQSPVLGITGGAREATSLGAWLAFQLAALHSPDDVRIVLLSPAAGQQDWGFLRWLPHCRDSGSGSLLIGRDDQTLDARVKELSAILDDRTSRSDRLSPTQQPPIPRIVVVLERASQLRRRPAIATLLRKGPAAGLCIICADSEARLLPEECTTVIHARADRRLTMEGPGDDAYMGVIRDEFPSVEAEAAARRMAPLRVVAGERAGGLPRQLGLLQLLDMPAPNPDVIRLNWRIQPSSTTAVVGVGTDGVFTLDISRDGPHALVAGTTGSGKSGFLQTLVASLAAVNAPEELSFLFIDFKGGAAFRSFAALPHTVGFVTNLDQALVQRALVALRSELDRRQRQLIDAGADSVEDYLDARARGRVAHAFPRLMIIIDEFAEMREQMPDFVDGLLSIARTGRSLGVHLVLATQRPHGVVSPEIRANASLRICLRVREESDSVDILDDPCAATIPRSIPGRAYASFGGEAPVAFQSARVGGRALRPTGSRAAPRVVPAPWDSIGTPPPAPAGPTAETTELDALVTAIAGAAAIDERCAPYRPWIPVLPEVVAAQDLASCPSAPDAPVFALADYPQQQRQVPLGLRLGEGHLAIIGSSRTGRTTALRTVAGSAAELLEVPALHMWAIDGGQGLSPLAELPHCGAVVRTSDAALVERLLERIEVECTARLQALAVQGFASVGEQRQSAPGSARVPWLMLLIDRWEAFAERYATSAIGDRLLHLLQDGSGAGLTVVVAGDESLLHGRTLDRIRQRLVLHLNDPNMAGLAGVDPRVVPHDATPGRAVTSDNVLVQVALLDPDQSGQAQSQALRAVAERARCRDAEHLADSRRPFVLRPLPNRVRRGEIPAVAHGVLLGVGGDEASPIAVDPTAGGMLVVGPAGTGKSNALWTLSLGLAEAGFDTHLVGHADPSWTKPQAPATVHLADLGSLGAEGLRALTDHASARCAVVIDDLDELTWVDLPSVLAASPGLAIIASIDLAALAFPSPTMRATLAHIRTRVVLCPPDHISAASAGLTLERGRGFVGPPGRGYLLDGSTTIPVQVALAT